MFPATNWAIHLFPTFSKSLGSDKPEKVVKGDTHGRLAQLPTLKKCSKRALKLVKIQKSLKEIYSKGAKL